MDKVYNTVVVGNTGVGKSALMDTLGGGDTIFQESDKATSETKLASAKQYEWCGKGPKTIFCDTQGLSDTQGADTKQIKQMIEEVKKLKTVDLFIIAIHGDDPRFTDYTRSAVQLFIDMFGSDFLSHSAIVFTKWYGMVKSVTQETSRRAEFQKKFKDLFGYANIPCYFIDSHYNIKQDYFDPFAGVSMFIKSIILTC